MAGEPKKIYLTRAQAGKNGARSCSVPAGPISISWKATASRGPSCQVAS